MFIKTILIICCILYVPNFATGILAPVSTECNLSPTIDKLVHLQRHRFLPDASAEVCIVTTNTSTLSKTHPNVVSLLITQHPVKFATKRSIRRMIKQKYANVVLLDATGWDKFPVLQLTKQFSDNPCHYIESRFIVLVTRSCFSNDLSTIVQFFDEQGIVNYAIVPMPTSASDLANNISIYTENRFSKEEITVQLQDLDNMHRLFPNKLTNLHGYHIRIGVKHDDFPYIIIWDDSSFYGMLGNMFWDIGFRILNLKFTFFHQKTEHYDADVYFDITIQREHFQHDYAFYGMGGMCLSCPVKYNRYFFSHLLKPFTLGGWIFLGCILVACWLLRLRFATIFRYDPVLQMLFGVIGSDYNQTFPARAILFALSCLSFFVSRTYISRILALMSVRTYHKRPKTIAEFMQSDYMMVIHKEQRAQYALDDFLPKILNQDEFEDLRAEIGVKYHYDYCSLQHCGQALMLTSDYFKGLPHNFFAIEESVIPNLRRLQFAKNSPIVSVMPRYLGMYYETGLWNYNLKKQMRILSPNPEPEKVISRVVFTSRDLTSVWMLLGVGLLISTVLFIAELLSKKRRN